METQGEAKREKRKKRKKNLEQYIAKRERERTPAEPVTLSFLCLFIAFAFLGPRTHLQKWLSPHLPSSLKLKPCACFHRRSYRSVAVSSSAFLPRLCHHPGLCPTLHFMASTRTLSLSSFRTIVLHWNWETKVKKKERERLDYRVTDRLSLFHWLVIWISMYYRLPEQ